MTLQEAAAYLNVNERYVRHLVSERRIAYHKLGRLLRFRVEDLDRFLASGRVEISETKYLPWPGRRGSFR